jgi:hypothetical protein
MNELGADTNLPQPCRLTTMRVCCPDLALKLAQILVEVRSPCNIPDPDSLGNTATLRCLLSDLIYWGFLDAFKLLGLTCLVFLHVCVDK